LQVFTSIAKDVMQRLQQEQAAQQSDPKPGDTLVLTSKPNKGSAKKGCCQ
jgi:hypothetical protein